MSDNLTTTVLNRLFDSVYGETEDTRAFLAERPVWQPHFSALYARQWELYAQDADLYPMYTLLEPVLGPFEINSDGTMLWLALGKALQEAYLLSGEA